jgi:hypothetical protein
MENKIRNYVRKEIIKVLSESNISKLYKISGLLITTNDIKTQSQILSDIRSITGVTTVDSKEYHSEKPTPNRLYNVLTVKVDPYPYLQKGEFDIQTMEKIIQNINNIKGVVKYKVENSQLVNIGI